MKNFKTYDELKAKLDAVLGNTPSRGARTAEDESDDASSESSGNFDLSSLGGQADEPEEKKSSPVPEPKAAASSDEDDDLAFFQSLTED